MLCVIAVRKDFNSVLKAMYRTRGETQRIDIADALGRLRFHEIDLGTDFEMAIGAIRHCLRIRNQFSHCAWYGDASGKISFTDIEAMARRHDEFRNFEALVIRRADLALLQSQEGYFGYVDTLLTWLRHEAEIHHGVAQANPFQRPKEPKQPDLYIL